MADSRLNHARGRTTRAIGGVLSFAIIPATLAAQIPDSARQQDTAAVPLAPVTISASIVPAAGRDVGSGVPARISIVSTRQLEAWRPRLLTEALRAAPGVTLYDDIGSFRKVTFGLRGFNAGPTVGLPAGVTVFLDGVRQNEPDAQEVNFDLLPMDDVERIEVLSGSASLLGPNALGGAVNLITYRGDSANSGADLEVSRGSFDDASITGSARGASSRGIDYYVSSNYDHEKGWRDATGAESYDMLANMGHTSENRALNLQLLAARSKAATAGSLPESIFRVAPRINFTAGDFDDIKGLQVALAGTQSTSRGAGSMNIYLRRSDAERFNVNQAPDDNVRNFTTNTTVGGNADWRWAALLSALPGAPALDARVGIDAAANKARVRLFSEAQPSGSEPDTLTTYVDSPSLDLAGFLVADLHLKRATFSAGLRSDYVRIPFRNRLDASDNTTSTYAETNPRAGVRVDVGGGGSVYASAGRSFRAPAILELGCADPTASCPLPFALGDDPPLRPVRATTYEGGGNFLRGPLLLTASAYRTSARNEIFFVASEDAVLSGFFTNIPRTQRVGAELGGQVSMFDDRFHGYTSVEALRATFESALTMFSIRSDPDFAGNPLAGPNDVSKGDRLPLTPARQLKAGGLFRFGPSEAGVDWRLVGRQWSRGDEANETAPLSAYSVTDVRVGATFGAWKASAIANNVFDDHHASFATFNENRQTGELERFLTPINARSFRVTVSRHFGNRSSQ